MKAILLFLLPLFSLVFAPLDHKDITITGVITNEQGQPVPSVTVLLKGTRTSTFSKADGSYSITVPDEKGVLIFTSVGFEPKEVNINGKTVLNVVLKAAKQSMNEVVVVGYGDTQKREDMTGSVSTSVFAPSAAKGRLSKVANPNEFNTEAYDHITENGFKQTVNDPLSTFSIDVDAASYSNVRRFLNNSELPPAGAVRVEEMINYFPYHYDLPKGKEPFSVFTEMSDCPWSSKNKLVMIGLQGKKVSVNNLPSSNLVFLIDVSGSMYSENKLPLVKASMKLLTDQLRHQDKVAIVVYAGAAGLVLPSTSGDNKVKIKEAIDQLMAGGSTAGGAGIKLAYKVARENFVKGNNRVILCTDGDFNIGASSDDEMQTLIEEERKSGVFLTVLGYGMGNYKDSKMQLLADKGNGNHAYIDGMSEAKKVLVNEFGGTLFTIAKDVKLQIEFNPALVQGYRLVGYENRLLNKEDFNDDTKDAGELGSGHTVTALYEIIPAGVQSEFLKKIDALKYQKNNKPVSTSKNKNEIMNIKLRYKLPDSDVSSLIEHPVLDEHKPLEQTSENFRFASAVAEFGMLLRRSEFKQNASYASVYKQASNALGNDEQGYRKEFIELVNKATALEDGKTVQK